MKKDRKTFFVSLDYSGEANTAFDDEDRVKEVLSDGVIVYKVVAVQKYIVTEKKATLVPVR